MKVATGAFIVIALLIAWVTSVRDDSLINGAPMVPAIVTITPTHTPVPLIHSVPTPAYETANDNNHPEDPNPTPTPTIAPTATPAPVQAAGIAVHPLPLDVEGWRSLVATIFPATAVDTVLRIMRCESGGNPYNHNYNPDTSDDSVGLMQINVFGKLLADRMAKLREFGYDAYDRESTIVVLKDPTANLLMALWISSGGYSFGPWSCR